MNGKQIHKPDGFDPHQEKLFELRDGILVYGNLKAMEKPKPFNVWINVKRVLVEEKDFDNHKVEGWLNCDYLEVRTDRDGVLEGNELYAEFYNKLSKYIDDNFDRRSDNKDRVIKSGKNIGKMFVDVIRTIISLGPNMPSPLMSGKQNELGIASESSIHGNAESRCTVREGLS